MASRPVVELSKAPFWSSALQLSVTGGLDISNSKGERTYSQSQGGTYRTVCTGLSRGRQPEKLVPRWSFLCHCESSGSRFSDSSFALVHGTNLFFLGRRLHNSLYFFSLDRQPKTGIKKEYCRHIYIPGHLKIIVVTDFGRCYNTCIILYWI